MTYKRTSFQVFDLDLGEYVSTWCAPTTPREAVIAAYAQSLGDYNTWDYEEKYGTLVTEGEHTVTCAHKFSTGKHL